MAGNGDRPLDRSHYDDITLQEYSLGQLLPEEEAIIRAHLAECADCRAKADEAANLARHLSDDLHKTLDDAQPSPRLSFDPIASQWRKPPRRTSILYRIQELAPATPLVLLFVLLVLAFLLLIPSSDAIALRSLELPRTYSGPPAIVAAGTDHGLVLVELSTDGAQPVMHLSYLTRPQNLQFSSDGRWLAVGQGTTLHVFETASEAVHIRIDIGDGAGWAWSPAGSLLAYTNGRGQLSVLDAETRLTRVLVPADEHARGLPVWSGDGQAVAYTSSAAVDAAHPRQSIWRVNPFTGFRSQLARNPQPDSVYLTPAAWNDDGSILLAWDQLAIASGTGPALYRIDAVAHRLEQLPGSSLAQGSQLIWPLSSQGAILTVQDNHLALVNIATGKQQTVPAQIPHPQVLAWSPNSAWAAYVVPGAPEGEALYLYAPQDAELRPLRLPAGATSKAVIWAGAEHLFVIRQVEDAAASELWLVPLTGDGSPQRILTNASLPTMTTATGWRWEDALTVKVLSGS